MNPVVALVLTIIGCIIVAGFIVTLAFRFVRINKILKENGEKLFGKK